MARRRRRGGGDFRGFLYGLARFLGDLQALSKGPGAFAKRQVRKAAYKGASKAIRKILR